ncbi:ADP-ribosyl cyclase/cyclic ADP-ribose hydrolase-like isoform X1 [Montipora capricornis]|uniref:ADP-ribosyl cyclase/cyclic ADP-ribose hydrolase-like isoform X1 n=1 Tax=Montipora capricornis TaxID=246305 RepID=UPI0035F1A28A
MVSGIRLSRFFIIIQTCVVFTDSRHHHHRLSHSDRTKRPIFPRSRIEQKREMLPTPNYKWPNLVNVRGRGLNSLTRPAWNRRILPGNRLLYRNPYQASNNKQLAYINQNVWSQKRSRPNVWNYLPFGDVPVSLYYNPSVAQVHSWKANARARPILQGVVGFRSRIDEDPILVEKRIKEYYDQRLNKNRNKWLFNRVQGTTPHLQEIFIGRCWDFVTNKGKHLQNPSKVDCQELWKTFLTGFAFKGPCAPTLQDYAPFFNMYEEKPLKDRVLFWSGTRELTHAYSRLYDKFTTLEDTLPGFVLNGLTWCGSKKGPGVNFQSCPYECSKQKHFWGQAAAKLAQRARGVVHVMLNGTRQHLVDRQIFPAFMDDSFLAENQLLSLPVGKVTEFRILVGHSLHRKSLERCDDLTVLELQNRAKARGLKTTCFDNPYFIRHLLCLENPADPLCLFKIVDQNSMVN